MPETTAIKLPICSTAPFTCTLKLPSAVFPAESLAAQLTLVSPIGKRLPDGGAQITGTAPSTWSIAWTLYATIAPAWPVASATTLDGM